MSALFTENQDALKVELTEARAATHLLEQNVRRLAEALAGEKEKVEDLESRLARTRAELIDTGRRAEGLRREVEQVALLEARASEAESDLALSNNQVDQLAKANEKLVDERDGLKSDKRALEAEITFLKSQITPLANLTEALKVRADAEAVIAQSLSALGSR